MRELCTKKPGRQKKEPSTIQVGGKLESLMSTGFAIKKYAEALETIPLTIAENAGMDPIDTMANLRAKQNHGQKWTGIDARNMKIADMMAINVVEPIVVKEQIIKSATEAACMILRIDDVIATSGAPGGGGMPGMG